MKLAFLGLGIMGMPMANHLKKAGFDVCLWNRSEKPNIPKLSLKDAIKDADFIMMCLGNDNSVEEVVNEFLPFAKKGAVIIDHTTTSANLARKLYSLCLENSLHFMDAPMTGGQAGAINGTLAMMCGGEKEIFEKSKEILKCYTAKLEYFGSAGMGQTCKMVNQIAIAGIIQSLAEAVNFAEKSGIEASKLFQIISDGAGGSWQMKNRHELMLSKNYQENFGFPCEWMLKDLKICLEESERINANLKTTKQIAKKYEKICNEINGRFDTSSLILLLK